MEQQMIPLVKFSCGCVGFTPTTGTKALLVWVCDSQWSGESAWIVRDMTDKIFTYLTAAEADKHIERFNREAIDASRWRDLKHLLASR
jgi:hypothetical protein